MISKHLDKNNLHHAYLLEGAREEIVPEVLAFVEGEIIEMNFDSLKMEHSRDIKSYAMEKGVPGGKRNYVISANSILLEAQNSLLKMFEEPIENTHFFLVVPDTNSLIKTFISRFYLISTTQDLVGNKDAEKFIKMPLPARIEFLKDFLKEEEETDLEGNEIIVLNSTRSKALKFLNALETALHHKVSKMPFDIDCFEHLFKVREFLRIPGSSAKTLMESVALIIPEKLA